MPADAPKAKPNNGGPLIACLPPLAGDRPLVHNHLVAEGYALSRSGISHVQLEVNGEVFTADHGLSSLVALREHPGARGAARAGFRASVETGRWGPGERDLTIRAVDRRGRETTWTRRVRIAPFEPPPPTMAELGHVIRNGGTALVLEHPLDAARLSGAEYFEVRGWAYSGGGLDGVSITLQGTVRTDANTGLARPDLAGVIDGIDLTASGFRARLDARALEAGEHSMTVVALGTGGRAMGVTLLFDVAADAEPALLPPPLPESAGTISEARFILGAPAARAPAGARPEAWATGAPLEELVRGPLAEAERNLRYRLAAGLASGCKVLDLGGDEGSAALLREAGAADVTTEPGEGTPFGLITAFGLLDRAADPGEWLETTRRRLAPGGVLALSVANDQGHPSGVPSRLHTLDAEGLRSLLGQRFAHVEVRFQGSRIATLIDAEDDFAAEVSAGAAPTAADAPFLVAFASDAPLPTIPPQAELTDPAFEIEAWHRLAAAWEERATWARAHADASRASAAEAWVRADHARRELEGARGSVSWRLTRPLRRIKDSLSRRHRG